MPTTSKDFATILAERQAYIDTLKTQGDVYALSYLENSFLYDCGNLGIAPLTTAQHASIARWKEATQ